MDINDLRSITTVVLMLIFGGIVWWAYGKGRKDYFEEAAAIPFMEEDEPGAGASRSSAQAEKRKES